MFLLLTIEFIFVVCVCVGKFFNANKFSLLFILLIEKLSHQTTEGIGS